MLLLLLRLAAQTCTHNGLAYMWVVVAFMVVQGMLAPV
jgi:hypothetical protein